MSDVHDGRTHSLNPPFTRIAAMFVRMYGCVCVFGCAVAISPDSRTRIRGHVAIMFAAMSSGRREVGCTVHCNVMRGNAMRCSASAIETLMLHLRLSLSLLHENEPNLGAEQKGRQVN